MTDRDMIYISVKRFEELIRTEVETQLLKTAYKTMKPYDFEKVLEAMFGARYDDGGTVNG